MLWLSGIPLHKSFHSAPTGCLRDILSRNHQIFGFLSLLLSVEFMEPAHFFCLVCNFGLPPNNLEVFEKILSAFCESIHRQSIFIDISGQRCSLFKQQRPCCSLSLTPSQATWIQSWRMACTEDLVQRFSKYRGRQYSPDWKLQVGEKFVIKGCF